MSATPARKSLAETGLALIAAAFVCAVAGGLHMWALDRDYGEICGLGRDGLPHCAACSASLFLLAAGLAAWAAALARPLRPA